MDDNSANHVGIDLNGSIDSVQQTTIATEFDEGDDWNAWVDYNGSTDVLEVRLSLGSDRPAAALLSQTVDLETVLGTTEAYVGFTSATGGAAARHDVVSWVFNDDFDPVGVPESGTTALSALLALLALGVFGKRLSSGGDPE